MLFLTWIQSGTNRCPWPVTSWIEEKTCKVGPSLNHTQQGCFCHNVCHWRQGSAYRLCRGLFPQFTLPQLSLQSLKAMLGSFFLEVHAGSIGFIAAQESASWCSCFVCICSAAIPNFLCQVWQVWAVPWSCMRRESLMRSWKHQTT